MSDFVIARNIRKKYGHSLVLKGIDLSLPSTGLIGIAGSSGCGKSTLLNILSGIDGDFSGSLIVGEKSFLSMSEEERSEYRLRYFGYVQQSLALLERDSVYENLALSMESCYNDDKAAFRKKIEDLLSFVGLKGKINERAATLSGGEKQRVAIARAMANETKVIFADEPTGSLDEKTSKEVFSLLRRISEKKLVVVSSHDLESLKEVADKIYYLKNGKIEGCEEFADQPSMKAANTIRLAKSKANVSLPFLTWINHARASLKAKKLRSFVITSFISAGLLGLGLSVYIYASIDDQVSSALSTLAKTGSLIAEKNVGPSSPIPSNDALDLNRAMSLAAAYPEEISGYGVSLMSDYEKVFCDENDFYAIRESKENLFLEYYSARSINDFLLLEDNAVLPYSPSSMSLTDVVIGLPRLEINRLCYELGLERSPSSLGEYIGRRKLNFFVSFSNFGAEFSNEDIFEVVGLVISDLPCFYHADPLWNYHYFVDHLHFYPVCSPRLENMQQMFALPFLKYKESLFPFIDKSRFDEDIGDVVLEPYKIGYVPTLEDERYPLKLNRVYLYCSKKYGISFSNMRDLQAFSKKIKGVLPGSSNGYYASSSSLLSGFSRKFYLCSTFEEAKAIGEELSFMDKDLADAPIDLPRTIISGSVGDGANAFFLQSGESGFSVGTTPAKPNEVALSSSVYERLNRPSSLFVAAERNSEAVGDKVIRDFAYVEVKVTGVKEENVDTVYVPSYWTYDFFLSEVGCSEYQLSPTSVMLDFKDDKEALAAKEGLEKAFPEMRFFSPSLVIESTVREITRYIGIILLAFSLLALLLASFLLLVAISIIVEEAKEELELLFRLGLSQNERKKSLRSRVLVYLFKGALPSLISLLVLEVIVHVFISKMFGTPISFSFSFLPVIVVAISILLLYLLLSIYVSAAFGKGHKNRY